jgi:TolB protein
MTVRALVRVWAGILLAMALLPAAAASSPAVAPPKSRGVIAFVGDPERNADIYVVKAGGKGVHNLSGNKRSNDGSLTWSSDGRKILFLRAKLEGAGYSAHHDLYVMNADGSHQRRLLRHKPGGFFSEELIDSPTWSPDGRRIAFVSNRRKAFALEIYLINADGRGLRNLTRGRGGSDSLPAWSPDGRKIAFVGWRGLEMGLYVMNADGSHERQLIKAGPQVPSLAWSPDGRKILFEQFDKNGPRDDLYVIDANGGGLRNLTRNPAVEEYGPAWSPDGRKIAFARWPKAPALRGIYVMKADGSGLRRLTRKYDLDPAWSPDGRKIAFLRTSQPGYGYNEIYVMKADGSGLRRLTHTGVDKAELAWQPMPRK